MFHNFLVILIGQFIPLAQFSIFLWILFLQFFIPFIINVRYHKSWINQYVYWLVKFDTPITNKQVPVDITSEFWNKDPIVTAIYYIVVTNDNVLVTIHTITTSSNDIIVLSQCCTKLKKVTFGQLNTLIYFKLIFHFGVECF